MNGTRPATQNWQRYWPQSNGQQIPSDQGFDVPRVVPDLPDGDFVSVADREDLTWLKKIFETKFSDQHGLGHKEGDAKEAKIHLNRIIAVTEEIFLDKADASCSGCNSQKVFSFSKVLGWQIPPIRDKGMTSGWNK